MIKAIFYARFHHERGHVISHQVPPGAITSSLSAIASPPRKSASPLEPAGPPHTSQDEYPLFDFSAIDQLVIPRQEFCDRLVTVCTNHYRVIGYPVCIRNEEGRYERNEFIFNLAIVLEEDAEFSAYTSIVRKLARMLRQLEEQSQFLSREEKEDGMSEMEMSGSIGSLRSVVDLERIPRLDEVMEEDSQPTTMSGSGLLDAFEREQGKKVYALCEMIMEDLNNYCECMIPIDKANTINLKLFPTRPPPAPVYAWHVPLSTVDLASIASSSDLTLTRIIPHIDGIASVYQIAELADTDLGLTRKAIQHLLYYGCVLLLDIFQFGAVYAPTAEIGNFIEDEEAQDEAWRYVCVGTYKRLIEGDNASTDTDKKEEYGYRSDEVGVDKARLVHLYTTLKQGQTLKHWCTEHSILLSGIDVRRFVTFGIIKGFLYRVHKYLIAPSILSGTQTPASHHSRNHAHHPHEPETIDRRYSVPHGTGRESIGGLYSRRPSVDGEAGDGRSGVNGGGEGKNSDRLPLMKYVDGLHCLDGVCTELGVGEKKVLEKMRGAFGDLCVVHR